MDELIRELTERKAKLRAGGGEQAAEKQRRSGKLTARERLDAFFDPGTFLEYDLFAKHIGTDYGLDKVELPADGVVTGVGKVDGRDVFAYSEDFTVVAGTFGERHGKKIAKTIDLARRMGCPVVGINDSGGARVTEQMGALSSYGELFFRQIRASGVVPQIALVMGPVAGGQAYSPGLMDFIFMVEKTSYMFIAGPRWSRRWSSRRPRTRSWARPRFIAKSAAFPTLPPKTTWTVFGGRVYCSATSLPIFGRSLRASVRPTTRTATPPNCAGSFPLTRANLTTSTT